ncbi:mechanosensitive ion channel family protein [Flavobacterium sp. S87F.05.LMB.W.Kidney.N]|uniref:mechanosensitive ion channel family protein n=1 Tax=Flavobacterium sp. S87F.05.LMB.W.Kidney.N TaxID=1278758 RepID=UPI0010671317|nr:mechanosensitive ion channel family protein [Flavobacterium sp. S87F.05.LMB.W.Kidney.N]TDX09942.1 MscS family membrane protein [Flavobacterium sp. S87F.05.LMB.W.Kidney.N]
MILDIKRLLLCMLFALLLPNTTMAQLLGAAKTPVEESVKVPEDSLGRRTPQGTVNGFIKAIGEQNYLRASQYFVLSKRSYRRTADRIKIAKTFQQLLDQGGNLSPSSIVSNKETGRTDDDLAAGVDLVGNIAAGKTAIPLYVENQSDDSQPALWLFSAETVESIMSADISGEKTFLDRVLPSVLKERKLGNVPIGHWAVVVVMTVVSYLLSRLLLFAAGYIIQKVWRKAASEKGKAVIEAFSLPVMMYLTVILFVALTQRMGISIIVRQRFSIIIITIGIVAFLILLWRLTDFVSLYTRSRMNRRGRISAVSAILFLSRTTKAAIVFIGIIALLGIIGVDVTAGLAALGIGGIALALGAQKTIENFVGSVSLIADQPLRVGDYCRVDDIKGTVESIGMRSTTLRTSARTIVTIPNGQLSASKIENFAHRDRFIFNPILNFRMDTAPDQMRYLLVELRSLLYAHPAVLNSSPVVRFTGITADALKVEITAYIEAVNFDKSQEVQEDLLLRMMDIIENSGTALAYPSQTLYMSKDTVLSSEKTAEVLKKVKKWKDNNELQLPEFDPARVEELKGSIKYPDEGSYKPDES